MRSPPNLGSGIRRTDSNPRQTGFDMMALTQPQLKAMQNVIAGRYADAGGTLELSFGSIKVCVI